MSAGRVVKIYTRGGDRGETALLGGARVPKSDPRVEAYGTLDELDAALGLALALDAADADGGVLAWDAEALRAVQGDLLTLGAGLAAARPARERERGTVPWLPEGRVGEVESWIDRLQEELPELDAFLLPGGSAAGAQLHVARTVCRRAERAVVRLIRGRTASEPEASLAEHPEADAAAGPGGDPAAAHPEADPALTALPYLNRVSDLLFVLARAANRRAGRSEAEWTPVRRRRGSEGRPPAGASGAGADRGEAADGPDSWESES